MLAEKESGRLFDSCDPPVQRALFPAVDRRRFFDQAAARLAEKRLGSNWIFAHHWQIRFAGDGASQTATVLGTVQGYSPYGQGRELLLDLLGSSGKHVKERAGDYECSVHLNPCDLELSFEEATRRLFGASAAPDEESGSWNVAKRGSLRPGDETSIDFAVAAKRDWHRDAHSENNLGFEPKSVELHAEVRSRSSSGLLGGLKSLLCKLRPFYADVADTAWNESELIRFVHDFNGRFGWRDKRRATRTHRGFLLDIPAGRPFWLAARNGSSEELLQGRRVESMFRLDYNGRLLPLIEGDSELAPLISGRRFFVRRLPEGIFFEWA